ncbi:MAG: SBBP repeat-containing protein [Bacteroidota bacterium]
MKQNRTYYANCNAGFIACVRNLWNGSRKGVRGMVFLAVVVGLMLPVTVLARDWSWAKRARGGGYDYGKGIATDENGNCYVTGYFNSSTITFGSVMLTNTDNSGSSDMYLVKYDSSGNVLWANCAGGYSADYGNSIATDGNGNCYVTGYFWSPTITFGSVTLINANSFSDMFVVKYDSNGNVVWAKRAGGKQL